MANQWFKMYGGEYLSDPKIERLNPVERSCWITILCMASMGENDGIIEFLTVESLLNKSGIQLDPYNPEDWEKAIGVLKKFQNLKMIDCNEDGKIIIKNWEKRQGHNLTVAERVAKSRAKRKDVTTDVTYVTTEEKRREENRIDKRESTISFLKKVPKEIIEEFILKFKCDEVEIKTKGNALHDYCESKGRKYKNYKSFLANALRKDFGERPAKNRVPIIDTSGGSAKIIGYK